MYIGAKHFDTIVEAAKLYFFDCDRSQSNLDDFQGYILLTAIKNNCWRWTPGLGNDFASPLAFPESDEHGAVVKTAMELAVQRSQKPTKDGEDLSNTSLLFWAIENGDVAMVRLLLAEKCSHFNKKAAKERTALHLAALAGNEEITRLLLENCDIDVMATDRWNDEYTALEHAASKGHENLARLLLDHTMVASSPRKDDFALLIATRFGHEREVQQLIDKNININAEVLGEQDQAVHVAAFHNHIGILKLLLENGADTRGCYNSGSPLHAAATQGHLAATEVLLDHGVDVSVRRGRSWMDPLETAVAWDSVDVARLMLERGVHERSGTSKNKLLSLAFHYNSPSTAKLLLEQQYGVDVTQEGYFGGSFLHAAAKNGCTDLILPLIERGLDIEAKSSSGRTPLQLAVSEGHITVVNILLANGAKVDDGDNGSQMLLQECARSADRSMAEFLLKVGADAAAKGKDGKAAIHTAAEVGNIPVLELLLSQKNIDIDEEDNEGATALHYAAENGHHAAVELLVANGADIESRRRRDKRTALHQAAENDKLSIVRVLLRSGANIKAKDKAGQSAFDLAVKSGSQSLVVMLDSEMMKLATRATS
jgi:ankyrin repeat protein